MLLDSFAGPLRDALGRAMRGTRDLEESEERFRTLFAISPDAIVLVRRSDLVYVEVNEAFTRFTGYAAEEVLGRAPGDRLWAEPEERATFLDRVRRGEPIVNLEVRIRCKDGAIATGLLSAREMALRGTQYVYAIVRDITDRVRLEDERHQLEQQLRHVQKLESLGRLAGGVAHDFNNVLTVILSGAQSLRRSLPDASDSERREEVEEILSAADRARELTRQLLVFSRRQVIAPQPLDGNRVLQGSRRMFERLLGESIRLSLDLAPGIGCVHIDPGHLDQLFMNLLANARDAMPSGGNVTVSTRAAMIGGDDLRWPKAGPGHYVEIEVRDEGVGMTPEVKGRIFEPFFTTKDVGQGTGLGLATVHGIVAQCGGHLHVESEPGQGTRFWILLPRSDASPGDEQARDPAATVRGGTESILLVEDDPAVRRSVLRSLAGAGYHVEVAGDGAEAVELAGSMHKSPDLLLTDVVMPRMDGGQLAKALRARWPRLRILFTSGYTDDRLTDTGVIGPAIALLQKPFTESALLERVRAVLDRT